VSTEFRQEFKNRVFQSELHLDFARCDSLKFGFDARRFDRPDIQDLLQRFKEQKHGQELFASIAA
jgi:hypothetical protein